MANYHRGYNDPEKYKVATTYPDGRTELSYEPSIEEVRLFMQSYDTVYRRKMLIEVYEDHAITYRKPLKRTTLKKVVN